MARDDLQHPVEEVVLRRLPDGADHRPDERLPDEREQRDLEHELDEPQDEERGADVFHVWEPKCARRNPPEGPAALYHKPAPQAAALLHFLELVEDLRVLERRGVLRDVLVLGEASGAAAA